MSGVFCYNYYMEPTFEFSSKLWLWSSDDASSWHFLTIEQKLAKQIKQLTEGPRRGFGAVKVLARIGQTAWKTSIFPTKEGKYFLPVKLSVRKSENLKANKNVSAIITLI